MLSGTSMFLPLTIVLTVTSREADPASPAASDCRRAGWVSPLVGSESTSEVPGQPPAGPVQGSASVGPWSAAGRSSAGAPAPEPAAEPRPGSPLPGDRHR